MAGNLIREEERLLLKANFVEVLFCFWKGFNEAKVATYDDVDIKTNASAWLMNVKKHVRRDGCLSSDLQKSIINQLKLYLKSMER